MVANSRTIKPTDDPEVLTVDGDIGEPATTDRIIGGALGRFGRIDTLINNAGVFIAKPFTDYTAEDYAFVVGVNLTGFFRLTQRVIAEMVKRGGGHVVNITTILPSGEDLVEALTAFRESSTWPGTRRRVDEAHTQGLQQRGDFELNQGARLSPAA